MIDAKKNAALKVPFPMIDSAAPESFLTGLSPTDTAYYDDGAGWNVLAITDTASEVGSTGMYSVDLTAGEMNHDSIMIVFAAVGAADTSVIIRTYNYDINDVGNYAANIQSYVHHLNGASWPMSTPFYWDPVSGNDSNDGLTKVSATLTFAAALALATAFHHDSINIVNSTGAELVIDTKVNVNKEHVHIIGSDGITIKPTSIGAATVTLSAIGCHIEGMSVETHTVGNENAIEVTADECEVHHVKVPYSRASAIEFTSVNNGIIHNITLRNPGSGGNGHGIQITGTSVGNRIHDFDILGAAGDGINFSGAGVEENTISAGDGSSIIHECAGWGFREQGGADDNELLGPGLLIEDNTEGQYEITANTKVVNINQYARYSDLPTNFADMAITITTGLVDITQTAADKAWVTSVRTLTSFGTLISDFWDEILTGVTHNITNSAAKRLRDISAGVVLAGTATGPGTGNNQIVINGSASVTDRIYVPGKICIVDGTGIGQSRGIIDYDGDTKTVTVNHDWITTPDNTSEFTIECSPNGNCITSGLAVSADTTTIQLASYSSVQDDIYNQDFIVICSGLGNQQVRNIADYNGTTKIATIDRAWDISLDTTSAYSILPSGSAPTVQEIADGVLDEANADHLDAGTVGKNISLGSTGGDLQDYDMEGA